MNREERIYSVTMTEDELRLFSEFLEQKEFARHNYQGLSPVSKKMLVISRKKEAFQLKKSKKNLDREYQHVSPWSTKIASPWEDKYVYRYPKKHGELLNRYDNRAREVEHKLRNIKYK